MKVDGLPKMRIGEESTLYLNEGCQMRLAKFMNMEFGVINDCFQSEMINFKKPIEQRALFQGSVLINHEDFIDKFVPRSEEVRTCRKTSSSEVAK